MTPDPVTVTLDTSQPQKALDGLHATISQIGATLQSTQPKPGWQTSEFWLKIIAILLTYLYASGTIPVTGAVAQVCAIAATMLGALGYTVARTQLKKAHALGDLGLPQLTPANDNSTTIVTKQAGFIRLPLMLIIAAIAAAVLMLGCSGSARMKTLGSSMATLDAVEITLQTYDTQHLAAIAGDPKNDSRAKIDAATAAWLAEYQKAHDMIANAGKLIAAAYKLDDDPSVNAAEAAAAQVLVFLTSIGVKP